jgi:hypothetical protein
LWRRNIDEGSNSQWQLAAALSSHSAPAPTAFRLRAIENYEDTPIPQQVLSWLLF